MAILMYCDRNPYEDFILVEIVNSKSYSCSLWCVMNEYIIVESWYDSLDIHYICVVFVWKCHYTIDYIQLCSAFCNIA